MHPRRDEPLAAFRIRLEWRLRDLRRSLPGGFRPGRLQEEQVRRLGLDPTQRLAVLRFEETDVYGVHTTGLVVWVLERLETADLLDANGNHGGAAEARRLAAIGCDCLVAGELSEDLLAHEYEHGDGLEPEGVCDYAALCDQKGGVEVSDAVGPWVRVERPRPARTIRSVPSRRRAPRRPRSRGHRARRALAHAPPDGDRLGRRPELARRSRLRETGR